MIPSLLGATTAPLAPGGSGFSVDLPGTTQVAGKTVLTPATATAGWRFNRDGTVDRQQGSWSYRHDWGTPTGGTDGDNYEIKATLNSGSTPSGVTVGVWYALSGTRLYYLYRSSVGSLSCNLTISVRDAATQIVQGSQTYTINATVNSDL